jgi:GNAT superfamily N-acetyltransferase
VKITNLTVAMTDDIIALMSEGEPYTRPRTSSDYWAYATLFSTTCPIAVIDGQIAGVVIAFRSQDTPDDVYVQDVIVHQGFRRRGVAGALLHTVRSVAEEWGCRRLYLTSEPENETADATWRRLGFVNAQGDYTVGDVQVVRDFKGPGKDRAVYELALHALE